MNKVVTLWSGAKYVRTRAGAREKMAITASWRRWTTWGAAVIRWTSVDQRRNGTAAMRRPEAPKAAKPI